MVLLAASLYLILTFFLTFIGIERQNQGFRIFLISLLLTPIVGIGYILFKKRNFSRVSYYYCDECDYIFPEKSKFCPICEEEGAKVRLKKYVSPYKATKKIRIVNFA
jgi:hypothetical protein